MPVTLPPLLAPIPGREAPSVSGRPHEALASGRAREALASGRSREEISSGAAWRRRIRLSLEAQRLRDLRLHPHDLPFFSGNQLHIIRVNGRLIGAWATPRYDWVRRGGDGIAHSDRLGQFGRLDPLELPAFELPPRYQNPTPPIHFTHLDLNQAAAGGPRSGVGGAGNSSGASAGASGAVGAGAAVLALAVLVLLARAVERCLDQRLFKLLRRRSDEWFTPNVLATSNHVSEQDTTDGGSLECPNLPPGDPPPPYSMCLPKGPRAPGGGEPPPPYSACYVAFGGPNEPLPRVHLNVPTFHSFQDTGQTIESAQDHTPDPNISVMGEASALLQEPEITTENLRDLDERSSGTSITSLRPYPSQNSLVA